MKQEDKDLLLRYLSMALPYGVYLKLHLWDDTFVDCKLTAIDTDGDISVEVPADVAYNIEDTKPYLRPMSSMTDEEKEDLLSILVGDENKGLSRVLKNGTIESVDDKEQSVEHFRFSWINFSCESIFLYINWMLKNHFDIMGLIPKGLAIAVTEGNNPYNITEE